MLDLIEQSDSEFAIAKMRVDRQYVNIGAIGITREGKSELIAQTTLLDTWILPTQAGGKPCTTATINVINGKADDGKQNFMGLC